MKKPISGRDRVWTTMVTTAALTFGVVGATVMTAGASPPVHEVERAQQVAERAAAADGAVRTLRLSAAREEAQAQARQRAQRLVSAAAAFEPVVFPALPTDWAAAGLDISKAEVVGDRLVQTLPSGARVLLTIDPELQSYLDQMLQANLVPHGGVVLLEPQTGRVLAMAENSRRGEQYDNFTRQAQAPSASVFKVVTAAALMEGHDVNPHEEVCYHGGTRGLSKRNIEGSPAHDNRCNDLEGALAWSINSLIAKQAYTNISADSLVEWAERFGYNQPIPFELPVQVSRVMRVEDPHERARAAAGFWHSHLSPLHGAMIGAALANDGVMMRPTLIDRYEAPDGSTLYEFEPRVFREVMRPETARKLGEMMVTTAEQGTARRYFGHNRLFPRSVEVSGKTGTLSNQDPFLRFTWFVGFARHKEWSDDRGVAVAGLMANDPAWHMVGPQAASEGVRRYYQLERERRRESEPVVASR
ncbi:penicillin-binding protein [Lujinxingia litoralis]|uniref:Penicillin-binding protein n=1 Tax=Lujinxingia litoralis TaxID=2211119 RepID=A0A328C9N1_9DELT|nr:penicillin-binding transpeptidase domain-containing protein [Lujinxingia litoralis]RAL23648.1 penicillin-binding protein [Lujinxingia litoralis]